MGSPGPNHSGVLPVIRSGFLLRCTGHNARLDRCFVTPAVMPPLSCPCCLRLSRHPVSIPTNCPTNIPKAPPHASASSSCAASAFQRAEEFLVPRASQDIDVAAWHCAENGPNRVTLSPRSGLVAALYPANWRTRYCACDLPAWPGSCGSPIRQLCPSALAVLRMARSTDNGVSRNRAACKTQNRPVRPSRQALHQPSSLGHSIPS